ncbi:PD-(D/E)XK nuclease family protein [Endozoicomonas sp. ALE010]|uniref:PD-(D/E)XK nuclease family protein n=1 Tax=Endozoicomonas sp. ALE010 TaxID=3403081 RepID=UPI003BB7D63B
MKIPEADSTIQRIYRHYEAQADNGFRPHLGASLIGEPCSRSLWYSFHWCTAARFDGRMLRLFETGQLAEARFADNLRAAGVQVYEEDPQTGQQFRVTACDGHFGGSMDGVGLGFVEAPKSWHVIEMKTHSEKSFKELVNKGVEESKPRHFAQMQVYMHLAENGPLKRAYYLAVNKNTDALYGERVKYDKTKATALVNKAAAIIASDLPPEKIHQDPSWYQCKFCDHAAVCHGQQAPVVNCRTCLHSTAIENGEWHCARYDCLIPTEQQRKGCQSHLYLPDLLFGFAEPVDSGEYWIQYRLKSNGQLFVTGEAPEQLKSSEIRAVDQKELLTDPNVQTIRQSFQGTLI